VSSPEPLEKMPAGGTGIMKYRPSVSKGMSDVGRLTCRAVLLRCIDLRLNEAILAWLRERSLEGDCDTVAVAGAARNLAAPASEGDREFVLKQLGLARELHSVNEVILMNHTDCGAYGRRAAFPSDTAERKAHEDDLRRAKDIVLAALSGVTVQKAIAQVSGSGTVEIRELA